jgi:hypothetical protein
MFAIPRDCLFEALPFSPSCLLQVISGPATVIPPPTRFPGASRAYTFHSAFAF